MQEFNNRVAVITGGASGVGKAMVELFLRQGMQVIASDISQQALDRCVAEWRQQGYERVQGVQTDVTRADSVAALADHCFEQFGNVHLLCNNAGVGLGEASRKLWTLPERDWDWGFAVHVKGVVNGIRAFVPRMLANDEEGHVVNTSSGNGGITSLMTTPIYSSSKAAVTSLTEVLYYQLLKEQSKIRVHCLFPGPHLVNTNILNSAGSRPSQFAAEEDNRPQAYVSMEELAKNAGVDFKLTEPEEVAGYVLEGIRNNTFWILPPSETQDQRIRLRAESMLQRANPALPD